MQRNINPTMPQTSKKFSQGVIGFIKGAIYLLSVIVILRVMIVLFPDGNRTLFWVIGLLGGIGSIYAFSKIVEKLGKKAP